MKNEIIISNIDMPRVISFDYLVASESFLHADRVIDFHVMIYVKEGCIYVTEDEIDYSAGPGEMIFLKAGVHHYGKYRIEKGTRWYYAHFYTVDCGKEVFDVFKKTGDDRNYCLTIPKKRVLLENTKIEREIEEFMEFYHSSEVQHLWFTNQKFFSLLSNIAFDSCSNTLSLSIADRISGYLEERRTQDYSCKDLEKAFFLSYKRLATVFKKEKGITMQQFHQKLRMETAETLLKTTLLSIGEISGKVGYSDMLYFSRCFHKCFGMSPTDYRKERSKVY